LKLLACLLLAAATLANAAASRRSSPPDPAAPSRRSSPPDPAAQKHFHSYALVYGTVFYEESGFLVRGARVEVRLKDSKKRWESKTNDEGSFAIQVPPGKAVYVVEAQIPGRDPDRKEVAVENDERVDVVLHLKGKQ
jgi:hypothetical protein